MRVHLTPHVERIDKMWFTLYDAQSYTKIWCRMLKDVWTFIFQRNNIVLFVSVYTIFWRAQKVVQWGSDIWPFEIRTFWRLDVKWHVFPMVSYNNGCRVPTIWKPNHLKSGRFFRISNSFWQNGDHLSGFHIPFEILTICNPTSFQPFNNPDLSGFQIPIILVK